MAWFAKTIWYMAELYTRMNRWVKQGVLDRVFSELLHQQIIRIRVEAVSLDVQSLKCTLTEPAR